MDLPISDDRFDRICRKIEKKLEIASAIYIGRTNSLIGRREAHSCRGTGVEDFDCMIHLDTFKTLGICQQVEGLLIRKFSYLHRCGNINRHRGGGRGDGDQHLYLMYKYKHGYRE